MSGDGGAQCSTKIVDQGSPFAIWVAEPLTKDARTLLRWASTSFFAGCEVPKPKVFDGKECHLYMRSNDHDFILARVENARLYFGVVRMTDSGVEVDLPPSNNGPRKPSDDLLGEGSSLCGGSC